MKSFSIPSLFSSSLIGSIKEKRRLRDKLKKDYSPAYFHFGPVEIFLSRHFGFCYGVENAVETAYKIIDENPGKKIYLLSEMIHNPAVNADLMDRGVSFIQDTKGGQIIPWEELRSSDIVIVPAFGTTLEIQAKLNSIGIDCIWLAYDGSPDQFVESKNFIKFDGDNLGAWIEKNKLRLCDIPELETGDLHMSIKGHKEVAEKIYKHLNNNL